MSDTLNIQHAFLLFPLLFGCYPTSGPPVNIPAINADGNVLISDQFNNRVIEVDPVTKSVLWTFGDGDHTADSTSVVGPNDAQRVGDKTLIAGTGVGPDAEPDCPNGCADNRVLLVRLDGTIEWQYGQAGVGGAGENQLDTPVAATLLHGGDVLITDQGNHRVIRVTRDWDIIWQHGTTGAPGADADHLNEPNSAQWLENGNVLIADAGNDRVIEVDLFGGIVWRYGGLTPPTPGVEGPTLPSLNAPAFASRLSNGNTLIADSGHGRVVEVDSDGRRVWQYQSDSEGEGDHEPTRAIRLAGGSTLITDQGTHDVYLVNADGEVAWRYGMTGAPGKGPNQLNGPYDAKVIGDWTGLTDPN